MEHAKTDPKIIRSNLLLLLTAAIWGMAFVAQSVGMDYVGPFTFTASRSFIAALVLIPVILFMNRNRQPADRPAFADRVRAHGGKKLLLAGISTGLALAAASSLQQYGIMYTTVGKAGFITALYILIVPLFGLFLGKKVHARIWLCIGIAIAGLYNLCMTDSLSLSGADILLILCACTFSIQILLIDYYSPLVDGVIMAQLQFLVCGAACLIPALIIEHPSLGALMAAWKPILYAGALSSGVGYTLQIAAQKNTDPVIASLLMSLESAFSLLSGWVILHQRLSGRELLGCGLMFAAIMISQAPARKAKTQGKGKTPQQIG